MLRFHISLPTLLLLARFLLPTIHAIPHPVPEPSFLDDILNVVTGDSDPSVLLNDLEDATDDVKNMAKGAWDTKVDGCLAVQCAAVISPAVLACVVSLIRENPLGCFEEIISAAKDIAVDSQCKGCPEAVENFVNSSDN
ncbi:hypothetical protein BKA67DRAFT_538163 [Truncatella angustata]|uniref:Uncharacterized protein n=1 Tax=Truncatella angustata TaxID=152316 RepID=A0A9P8UHL8_9PEZI|nr:uncharacterized protein BKA67DRAFT_538163 [Truncatella angustata]KAH6652345.1 hypothetical protein BKA67DRAFT_538163 [Truncatella angustata]